MSSNSPSNGWPSNKPDALSFEQLPAKSSLLRYDERQIRKGA